MLRKNFFDFFPPPNFLLMSAVGLSISEDAVRYIQLKSKSGKLTLSSFGEEKLPEGSIVEGNPAKADQVVAALKKLKHDHHFTFVNVALPEDKAYVFKSVVSVPKGANLSDSVSFILEENIPLSPAETVFDYSIIKEDRVAATDEVVVCAFPQETIEKYLEICKQAGLNVLQFDTHSEAAKRAVISKDDLATKLIVNFAGDKVVLAIVSRSLVQFVSIVNPNIEASKKTIELHAGAGENGTIEQTVLLGEIKKICSYFQSGLSGKTKTGGRVESIIVIGDVDPKLNIITYLSKNTGIPTSLANVWQNAFSFDEIIPEIPFEDSLHFASAIGLALPQNSLFAKTSTHPILNSKHV